MWNIADKSGEILGLVIGCGLIVFRKRFSRLLIQKQLEERETLEINEDLQQIKEMKLEGFLQKGPEIMALVIGICILILNLPRLFLPQNQGGEYFRYVLLLIAASPFAAGLAILVEYTLMFRFLWRKVHRYAQAQYPDWHSRVNSSFGADKVNAVRAGPTDDPVLRTLQKRAGIYSLVCFVALFVIFLFALYVIVTRTG